MKTQVIRKVDGGTKTVEICDAPNANLIAYEEPRKDNPFETTVFAFDTGEARCERLAAHGGKHGFVHRGGWMEFA